MECIICGGSKQIRLPIRHRVAKTYDAETMGMSIVENSRTYPCPECESVQDHKLHIAYSSSRIRNYELQMDPAAMEITQKTAASGLADYMLRHNLVQFRERPAQDTEGVTEIIAKLAVVDPARITTIEQRVKDSTRPMIDKVASLAVDKIYIWGRDLGRKSLLKEEAARFVLEAAREVASE